MNALADRTVEEAAPFFAEVADAPPDAEARWIRTADGVRLRSVTWPQGQAGTAFVFSGRTEYVEKYGRVARRLAARGLAVATLDWRGQGLSDRYAPNPKLGYVEDFRQFQLDVAALLGSAPVRALPQPWYLVSHSMGGAIALRCLLERADFAGAVFCAPMWQLQMKTATRELTNRATQLAQLLGLGARRLPGTSSEPTALANGFDGNVLTSDPEQYAWVQTQVRDHPELGLGGPSLQWTRAALQEIARLYVAPLPRLPVLVLLGAEESVVAPGVIRKQAGLMPGAELAVFPGARHELFLERPEVQDALWTAFDDFLARAAR